MTFNETKAQIVKVLADGKFHSGGELANRLGLSRAAIWKQIKGLADFGISIDGISGKGYRIEKPLELLDPARIKRALSPFTAEHLAELEIHRQIHSTNQHLLGNLDLACAAATVCLAEMQTHGRGRSGRQWISPFGHNIHLSLMRQFSQGPELLSAMGLAVGVCILRALKKLGISGVGLKWPNDILFNDKKLGGVLIEVAGQANGPCTAVIGIGLNFFIPSLYGELIQQDWIDLNEICSDVVLSRNQLIAEILNELIAMVEGYEQSGLAPYLDDWRHADSIRGRQVTLFIGHSQQQGRVEGISDDGLLIIRDKNGSKAHYASGEVSFSDTLS